MSPRCVPVRPPRSEALPEPNARRHRITRGSTDERPWRRAARRGNVDRSQSEHTAPGLPLSGLKVVVVDDDESSLDYFSMALQAFGAVVTAVSTAADALRVVAERRPDVVLTDLAMMGQDGYWLVREIRGLADETVRTVPVVAATAYGREHSRDRALAAGFTEHLRKPVDPDVLWRTIAEVAGR